MKKILSILVAMLLTLGMGTAALAEGTNYTDQQTVDIKVSYTAANSGAGLSGSPAEQLSFNIAKKGVTNAAAGVTVDNMPTISTPATLDFPVGAAGDANNGVGTLSLTLPGVDKGEGGTNVYTGVGVYEYEITQTPGTNAGVDYHAEPIKLLVTVLQDTNGLLRIGGVHAEQAGEVKTDTIVNTYSAGSLSVKKQVTGNMGDKKKEFGVTVEFTSPEGKTVNSVINYTEDGAQKVIVPSGDTTTENYAGKWSALVEGVKSTVKVKINLKHDETVTFTNIPYGVTYKVTEDDYTSEAAGKYEAPTYSVNGAQAAAAFTEQTIGSAQANVIITNNKGLNVDTGISLDSIPYILLLVFAVGGLAVYFAKKRPRADR